MTPCVVPFACLALAIPAGSDPDVALERRLAERVSAERAQRHVRELAALGPRMGGTASGERAVEWRVRAFRALGLEVEVHEDPEAWTHEEESWRVVAHVAGLEPRVLERAWPWGFSPAARGRAPLATVASSERAALLLADAPSRSEQRRSAVVLVDGVTTPGGAYPAVRHLRRGDGNPVPVFGLSTEDGRFLRERLAAGDPVDVEYDLRATVRRARPRTVVASLAARPGGPRSPGTVGSPAPGFVLFCAHGDSDAGGPGANDNASGEAIVLEIAAAWSSAVAAGELEAPPVEVRFAVWGSEIASTRAFLERGRERGEMPLAVVNFDQAGFGTGADVLFVEPDDVAANRDLVRDIVAVLADQAGADGFPARWATTRSQGGTDSYVFSDSDTFTEGGRPAVTLYASAWDRPGRLERTPGMPGESWNDGDVVHVDHDDFYHSAGDLPENTTDREPWNMAWCARAGWLGVLRWLARGDRGAPGGAERGTSAPPR